MQRRLKLSGCVGLVCMRRRCRPYTTCGASTLCDLMWAHILHDVRICPHYIKCLTPYLCDIFSER
jgi:hypothetical protein